MIYNKPTKETEEAGHRLGKFIIDNHCFDDHLSDLRPLFGKMVIVRAETRPDLWGIEYIAISDMFEPVPRGSLIPTYEIIATQADDGSISFSVQKDINTILGQVKRLVDLDQKEEKKDGQ